MAGSPSDAGAAQALSARYRSDASFFPLVAAVLSGTQDGVVLPDPQQPGRCAYVEHAFGFAQVIGTPSTGFGAVLQRRLLEQRDFAPAKVRLYTPWVPPFLAGAAGEPLRSERQRYVLPAAVAPVPDGEGFEAVPVTAATLDAMDAAFGVLGRFWRTADDFLRGALAVLVSRDGVPAALCYAAAVAGGRAEIDVVTVPDARRQGAGRHAAAAFVRHARSRGVEPLWDCFTNNAGSVALARALGFQPAGNPYVFFTIPRAS
ncbi:GNAT family N-acetyltransferase [Ramlibacter algicola]|uniref:GNAT family N-acetyltransferase n=1 Tax=Ramlibacter algicola TaxID=2795217 RepID=A0A934PWT2_9BURK|nr:GNAT family N-acetyltransferase [Ramlibacter algicola]MBK0391940.1 GNAT family N-acetyltransferase [Ramlibacter algicola]